MRYKTSEAMTSGHPDKLCDLIADMILDAYLKEDPESHVAIEVAISCQRVIVMGEVRSNVNLVLEPIIRNTILAVGYDDERLLFDGATIPILIDVHTQSPDIARGVDQAIDVVGQMGAGDQGMCFGYACLETEHQMPYGPELANKLAHRLEEVRKEKIIPYLRPDGKVQVTIGYENEQPISIHTILVSAQHEPGISLAQMKKDITQYVIEFVLEERWKTTPIRILVNPTGQFVTGGPAGDSGLTGRKIIADTYGGIAHHGGGSFSGKDASKVDRTGAYYARYVANQLVASNCCTRCEISVSYAIGVAKPIAIGIDTFHTNRYPEPLLLHMIETIFDFRPSAMIQTLNLKNITYHPLTNYGHVGWNAKDYPWEKIDAVDQIKRCLGI